MNLAGSFWRSVSAKLMSLAGSSYAGGSIGSLGEITFEVSAYNDIFTPDGYKRSAKARLATHEVIGEKPLTEFCGADLQTVSFSIKLHAAWGVNPRTELGRLVEYCEQGEVLSLVLGGEPVGEHKWLIESVGESVDYFDYGGAIIYSTAEVSLREYVENEVRADAGI